MSEDVELSPDILKPGAPQTPLSSEGSGILDLSEYVQEVDADAPRRPPSLTEDASLLWPTTSGLHASLLSTSTPVGTAESWQWMVEQFAEESRRCSDPALRGAMLCEAGRILIDRLGRQEEGELLLRRANSPIAEVLRKGSESGTSSLAAALAELEKTGRDEAQSAETRAAAWIEFGQLCEERTPSRARAYEAYREALALCPEHPVALHLAAQAAEATQDRAAAIDYTRELIRLTKSSRQRVALLLEFAELVDDPDERLIVLEQAHQTEPREETALRRLIRALSAVGDTDQLGALYRELARIADDPISASTALHLAFLTLAEAGKPLSDLVLELAERDPERPDSADVLAPLAEVALYVEQRIAAGDDPRGLPENVSVLERLSRALDDPREQALVREQLARIRLNRLRAEQASSPAPADTVTGLPKLSEERSALCDRLEADLRFCLVHLPEHRWVSEALAEVLETRGNLPGLVLHLQEWARTETAGPGRAAILLRLGAVHEYKRRDLPRAAEIYELAAAEDPDNPNCLRALGHVYEKMRRWPQAVACLRRQAEETHDEPERIAALRRVATLAEQELKDVDLAVAALEQVAKLDPDDLLSLYQLVKLCRPARRTTVLITALELLIERVDDDVARTALLVELGEVLELQLKQRAAAREHYERALSLSPGYAPALRALGRLYRDNGQIEELIGLLDPKVDTITDPAVLALKAGRVCADEAADTEGAIEHLRRAYRTNPDLVPAREQLLALLTATGRIQEAYDLLRAQDPPKTAPLLADHHYRLGLLAEACARRSDGGRKPSSGPSPLENAALQHYRAALVHQPDHGLAFERSRRLLVTHHDLDNLIRLIENLLPSEGDEARAMHLVHLGRLHVSRGDTAAARKAYDEALAASGDDPIVRREYEGLLRLLGDETSLPALYLRWAQDTTDTHLKATMLVEAAELLLSTGAQEDHDLAGKAVLEALQVDPGNPYAVRHLERLLSEPTSSMVLKDAVSARAVRAQSDAERAIFYVESAELLERVGAWNQARRAYLAAKGALPHLTPAELGLQRTSSENRRTAASTEVRTSIHVLLAEARDAAVRASRGDEAARSRAIRIIGEILQRDPLNRDTLGLARTLVGQLADPTPLTTVLAAAFRRVDDADLLYELALFLGEHSLALEDAIRYYQAASKAKPKGRRALRGLVNTYRQLGDDRRAAEASERLLELFEPSEPTAIDLRMGIASFLAADRETLPRALEHARIALEARPDEPRAIGLMADILERAGHRPQAAALLDRLAARERNRDRLHDIYLRKARLLGEVRGRERDALQAIERAASLNPGNRDTVTMLVDQLGKTGQTERVATYLAPIRTAFVGNVGRGALSLRDLNLLAKVAQPAEPELAVIAGALLRAIESPDDAQPLPPARVGGLRQVLDTPSLRAGLYDDREPGHLHGLLQAIDGVVGRLGRDFPVVNSVDANPVPRDVDGDALAAHARRLTEIIGVRPPRINASSTHNTAILIHDPICSVRLGTNLFNQGDMTAWRGLVAVAVARAALGGPRSRAVSPPDMDLLLSACFEVVEVFNPMTADPDPRRFKDLVANLRNILPRRQRKAVETACQALASHAFDAGTTARATLGTDLGFAVLISGDIAGALSAACLLDGVVGGTLKQRINRSRSAQRLVITLVSDEFVQAHCTAR